MKADNMTLDQVFGYLIEKKGYSEADFKIGSGETQLLSGDEIPWLPNADAEELYSSFDCFHAKDMKAFGLVEDKKNNMIYLWSEGNGPIAKFDLDLNEEK